MKLSEITRTLREIQVSPVKTLGQNFLHDQNLARWIVDRAGVSQNDFVLEIGPGLGALTAPALARGARVLGIEKDARLVKFLSDRFRSEQFEIIHGDALEFDLRALFPRAPVTLLGNLPYYISSQLLLRFVHQPTPISCAVLMLQKEVAARLSAQPGSKDYGVLTIAVQTQSEVEYLRTVSASVFFPQPEVDSALVRLRPRSAGDLPDFDREILMRLVRAGFSQRRKQLGKLLKNEVTDWATVAEAIGADERTRAEELALEQWIALANIVDPPIAHNAGTDPDEPLTVVDESDCPTGAASRRKVHANNFRHRAVHLLIFNPAGELLLQKRSRWKDNHPGLWDSSAAGHVGADEDYDATAQRELEEELGVNTALVLVSKIPASEKTGWEFIQLYRGEHSGPFSPSRSEIDALEFFPTEVIAEWLRIRSQDFAPGFLECWHIWRQIQRER